MSFLQKANARLLSSRNTKIPFLSSFIIKAEEKKRKQIKFQKSQINYNLTFYKPRKPFQRQEAWQEPADGGWHMAFCWARKTQPICKILCHKAIGWKSSESCQCVLRQVQNLRQFFTLLISPNWEIFL